LMALAPARRGSHNEGIARGAGGGTMLQDILYLSAQDVRSVAPPMSDVIDAVERMFREKAAGSVEMPPKPGIHPSDGAFIHAMPAYVPALRAAGMKWVSAYPRNPDAGLPQVAGLIVLNDPDTGLPAAILDAGWITAARTAAASALAARYLARPESAVLGVLGCGVQGRSHLEAMAMRFPIGEVVAYDARPERAARYAEEMAAVHGLSVRSVDAPRAAVADSDIVVTAGTITRPPHATIEGDWIRRGTFAMSVDFASYWSCEALRRFDRLVTDDLLQFAAYRGTGYFEGMPEPGCELASLVTGAATGRGDEEERTFCCNLGLAAEDMAVAPLVVRAAMDRGVGERLPR